MFTVSPNRLTLRKRLPFVASLAAAVLVPAALFGLWLPFWRFADSDIMFAYEALLVNQGLPLEFFDLPGWPAFVSLAAWYRLLHDLGLLAIDRLSQLPPAVDTAAIAAAWQSLIVAGRLSSMLLASVFVVGFALATRPLVRDTRVAWLAGWVLAFSVGIETQARVLRAELMATTALMIVFFALLAAGRARAGVRAGWLALAGLCCGWAMAAKVQSIFILLAIPVLVLPFGRPAEAVPPSARRLAGTILLVAAAAVLAVLAASRLADGVALLRAGQGAHAERPLPVSGFYQAGIAFWVVAGVGLYAAVWRVRPLDALAALAALGIGVALAVGIVATSDPRTFIAVTNPVETMLVWSQAAAAAASEGGQAEAAGGSMLHQLLLGAWRTLALRTVVLHPNNVRQTVLIEWLAMAGFVAAWRRRDWRLAAQVGLLLGTAWAFEIVSSLRGFKRSYAIYTDPLVILASALVAAHHRALLDRFWQARQWRFGLIAAYAVLGMAWPATSLHRGPGPRGMCDWQAEYARRLPPFPACRTAAGALPRGLDPARDAAFAGRAAKFPA